MKLVQKLLLSAAFATSAASANDNNTDGVVCDATNMTNLELVRTSVTPAVPPQVGNWYAEIEVRNRGNVPNAVPLTYSIYKNNANGVRVEPAIDTRTNPFPMEGGDDSIRFFSPTHDFGDVSIPSYTVTITHPCSTNNGDNTLVGPLPGTIGYYPPHGDGIFRDGFENFYAPSHYTGSNFTVTEAKFANDANGGVIQIKNQKAPALTPKP